MAATLADRKRIHVGRTALVDKAKETPGQLIVSIEHADTEREAFTISFLYLDANNQENAINLEVNLGELFDLQRIAEDGLKWHDEHRPASRCMEERLLAYEESVRLL